MDLYDSVRTIESAAPVNVDGYVVIAKEIGADNGLSYVGNNERPAQFAETEVDRHHFRVVRGDGAAVCRNERVTTSTSPAVA